MEVRRLPVAGLLRQRAIEERLHLIRHKRRSISVAPLELLPDDAAAAATAGEQQLAAKKPAAVCGGGPGGAGSLLEF